MWDTALCLLAPMISPSLHSHNQGNAFEHVAEACTAHRRELISSEQTHRQPALANEEGVLAIRAHTHTHIERRRMDPPMLDTFRHNSALEA